MASSSASVTACGAGTFLPLAADLARFVAPVTFVLACPVNEKYMFHQRGGGQNSAKMSQTTSFIGWRGGIFLVQLTLATFVLVVLHLQ